MTKLTANDGLEIRRLHYDKGWSYRKIAAHYNVSCTTVSRNIAGYRKRTKRNRKKEQKEQKKGKRAIDQLRLKRLEKGALKEAENVKDELITLYRAQRVGVEELLVEWDNVRAGMKDLAGVKDDITCALYGKGVAGKEEMIIMPVYKFKNLSEEQQANVDRMLPEWTFSKLTKLFMMMQKATEQLKETLAQLTMQERVMVQYFDNRQVIIFDKSGYGNLLLQEVIIPVLRKQLPTTLAQPVAEAMTKQCENKLPMLERFGDDEDG